MNVNSTITPTKKTIILSTIFMSVKLRLLHLQKNINVGSLRTGFLRGYLVHAGASSRRLGKTCDEKLHTLNSPPCIGYNRITELKRIR
jgi:hypothetical protein